ncbi:MAG: phosphate ABC transporter substrate-binding protein [Methanomassiliicoccaceae archaeon]|nr:phosphate ABC transporter substrate-binding protein [Methanomassiliicoccaceae archaeon]
MDKKMILAIAVVGIVCLAGGYMIGSSTSDKEGAATIFAEGSTTVAPLMNKYAEIYEGYENVRIEVIANGSQNGVDAANSGNADIGMSSRNKGHSSHAGLTETKIATDTVVLIVGSNAGITSLTKHQIIDIYNGTITNWNQVGGNNATIVVVDRDQGSGTRSYFEESFASTTTPAKTLNSTRSWTSMAATGAVISYVESNPNAIAYVSLGSLTTNAEKNMALSLNMNNVEGSGTAVSPISDLSNYPLKRDLVLLTKGTPTGKIAMFIGWMLSPEGQKIAEEVGFLPL